MSSTHKRISLILRDLDLMNIDTIKEYTGLLETNAAIRFALRQIAADYTARSARVPSTNERQRPTAPTTKREDK